MGMTLVRKLHPVRARRSCQSAPLDDDRRKMKNDDLRTLPRAEKLPRIFLLPRMCHGKSVYSRCAAQRGEAAGGCITNLGERAIELRDTKPPDKTAK